MSIRLDEKRGVNPGMMNCFFCNEPKGIILWGKLTAKQKKHLQESGIKERIDGEAPHHLVIDKDPCDKCKGYMEQGVILISVDEAKTDDPDNPYRTGNWCVIKDEAIRRMVQPEELAEHILEKRVAFVPDDAWAALSLPQGELEG